MNRSAVKHSVRVAIVGYRCAADIRHCLDALSGSSYRDFEIHVCENGGGDAYRDLVHELAPFAVSASASVKPSDPRAVVQTRTGTLSSGQKLFLHEASDNLGYAG